MWSHRERLRAGLYDKSLVQRFQSERQSLAIMDHPAIAKVFDAGATQEGRPYFAMEYVDGPPITDYCDRKKLGIRERLKLFMQVCDGVQHAHQKAIIHRDLKPSNKGVRYEERGPAVNKRSKQLRTWKMIRQLRTLGYRIEPPNPQPSQAPAQ